MFICIRVHAMSFVHFTAKTHRYISKSAYEYVPQIDILMFVFILRACCCFLLYVYVYVYM